MGKTGSPHFITTLAYLGNIVVSVALIWYLINFFFSCSTCAAKPLSFVFFVAFFSIIAISVYNLFGMLFPDRKKSCPVCVLISRIAEIDIKG